MNTLMRGTKSGSGVIVAYLLSRLRRRRTRELGVVRVNRECHKQRRYVTQRRLQAIGHYTKHHTCTFCILPTMLYRGSVMKGIWRSFYFSYSFSNFLLCGVMLKMHGYEEEAFKLQKSRWWYGWCHQWRRCWRQRQEYQSRRIPRHGVRIVPK